MMLATCVQPHSGVILSGGDALYDYQGEVTRRRDIGRSGHGCDRKIAVTFQKLEFQSLTSWPRIPVVQLLCTYGECALRY
jgi:hypothetical protein